MTVASIDWLLWIGLTVGGFWLHPARLRDLWIPLVTITFLASHAPMSAALLLGFTLGTYYLSEWLPHGGRSTLLVGSALVGVLVYYKLGAAERADDLITEVAIPLGLSYYTFRCLHYLIEKYKGTLEPHGLREFASYLMFLPTLPAGPIHRFNHYQRDYRRHRWDYGLFAEGLERMLFGYVKIVVLANQLVNKNLRHFISTIDPEHEALVSYMSLVAGALHGYLQFAGYSDVAIGFALLLGYRVIENFNWPFLRRNISEFWQSWHISLSSWCRDYIYMVVVSLTRRPAVAALASMLVLGLWHELSLRYLLWGLYHGVGIAAWQSFQSFKKRFPTVENRMGKLALHCASVLLTFHFVIFGFVILQQPTIGDMLRTYETILFGWR